MTTDVEFLVEDIQKDRSGKLVLVGVPNRGRSVRVGDQFVVRYEVLRTLDDVLNERPTSGPVNHKNIALTVTAIDSMRSRVEELPLGVTGALYIEGDGVEHVTKRSLLRTSI